MSCVRVTRDKNLEVVLSHCTHCMEEPHVTFARVAVLASLTKKLVEIGLEKQLSGWRMHATVSRGCTAQRTYPLDHSFWSDVRYLFCPSYPPSTRFVELITASMVQSAEKTYLTQHGS